MHTGPVLYYGCEVWGVGNNDIVERICKILLHVKKNKEEERKERVPLILWYTKSLGNFGLSIIRLNYEQENKKRFLQFCTIFSLLNYGTNILWLKSVKSILDECGLSYVWNNQYFVSAT